MRGGWSPSNVTPRRNICPMATSTERMRALRARRAASIEPGPGAVLRDADELLAPAVEETLTALKLGDRDTAAAQLARRYASAIDQATDPAWGARWLGPLLLKALESLGATPMARKGAGEPPGPQRPNKVAQLRAAHAHAMRNRAG
jgi:hypothetical protein